MKRVTVSICLLCACWLGGRGVADDAFVYPTLPGTNLRDYSKPGARIEGDKIYPTLPGSNLRDYSKPGARIEDGKIYPTLPGSSLRDYSKPGARIEGDKIYPTLPGSSLRDYSKPGARIEDDKIYPTLPGTGLRDYSKPGVKIEENNIHPTLPGGGIRDYSKPGARIESDAPLSDSGAGLWQYQNSRPEAPEAPGFRPGTPSDATNNAPFPPRARNNRIDETTPEIPTTNDDPFPGSDEE